MQRLRTRKLLVAGLLVAMLLAACASGVSPTPTSPPTLTFTPSASPTETATSGPSATPTEHIVPTRDPNITPVAIVPCLLINAVEASSALGEPVSEPMPTQGGCVYFDSAAGQYALSYFTLPPEYSREAIRGHGVLLGSFGATITNAQADELATLGPLGDMVGVIDGLSALAKGATAFSFSPEDLGDGGLWVSKQHSFVRQGMLLVARNDTLIGLDLLVTNARDEASLHDAARYLVGQLLERLPEHFTLLNSTSPEQPTLPPATVPPTLLTPAATLVPGTTVPASATVLSTQTQAPTVAATATIKPPAFSVPILAGDTLFYGGNCGSNLQTVTVTVVDPTGINPVTNVSIAVRLVGEGGVTTDWRALPMRSEGGGIWLKTLVVEQDLPGYEQFTNANVEYYFLATNRAGISAESAHYGISDVPLKLVACPKARGTP